jgi:vacuolar protein sorting-associated protein 54
MTTFLAILTILLQTVEWEAGSNSSVHTYAELLVKETTTLHKVLSKYLESNTVQAIMLQVIESIRQKLYPQYTEIELKSDSAKKSSVNSYIRRPCPAKVNFAAYKRMWNFW